MFHNRLLCTYWIDCPKSFRATWWSTGSSIWLEICLDLDCLEFKPVHLTLELLGKLTVLVYGIYCGILHGVIDFADKKTANLIIRDILWKKTAIFFTIYNLQRSQGKKRRYQHGMEKRFLSWNWKRIPKNEVISITLCGHSLSKVLFIVC